MGWVGRQLEVMGEGKWPAALVQSPWQIRCHSQSRGIKYTCLTSTILVTGLGCAFLILSCPSWSKEIARYMERSDVEHDVSHLSC